MGISVPSSPSQSPILQVARVVETSSNVTLSGLQTIDGVLLVADERVLLTAQSDGKQNGLWKASSGAWTRPSDYESGATIEANIVVPVSSGTANADTRWQITTDGTIVVDTTSTTWAKTDLGITAVVDDTSPQLGGNLNLDTHNLVRGVNTVLSTTTDGDAIHPNDVGIGAISDPARKLEILDASNPQLRLTHTDGAEYMELQSLSSGDAAVKITDSNVFVRSGDTSSFVQVQNTTTGQADSVSDGLSVGMSGYAAYLWNRETNSNATLNLGCSGASAVTINNTNDVGIGLAPGGDPARKLEILDASNPHIRLTQTDGTDYTEIGTIDNGQYIGSTLVDVVGSGSVHSAFIARGSGTSCFFQAQHSAAQSDNVNKGLTVGINGVNAQLNNREAGTLNISTHNRVAIQVNDYPSGGSSIAYQPGTVPAASFPDDATPAPSSFPVDSAKTVLISTGSVQLPTLTDPQHVGVQYVVMNTSGSTLTGAVTTTGTVKMYDKNNTAGVQTTDIDAYSAKTFVFIESDKYVMVG